jgi:hypothetical protein
MGAWAAAYSLAWVYAVVRAAEVYGKLPKRPPDCFIATAAAKGHPGFVGAVPCLFPSGRVVPVNRQVLRLKRFELELAAVLPRFHRRLRRVYNRLGCSAAARITHPVTADLVYVCLKPFEWFAVLAPIVFRWKPVTWERLDARRNAKGARRTM